MLIRRLPTVLRRTVGACAMAFTIAAPQVASAETLADALVGAYTHSGLLLVYSLQLTNTLQSIHH